MINKQSLWFITLFSLIIILGIYYVTLPNDSLSVIASSNNNVENVSITENDFLIAQKVEQEEMLLEEINNATSILLNSKSNVNEKNLAYTMIEQINNKKSKILEIENTLKKEYKVDSCVTINDDKVIISLNINDQGNKYANDIINTVSKLFEDEMYITVQFK